MEKLVYNKNIENMFNYMCQDFLFVEKYIKFCELVRQRRKKTTLIKWFQKTLGKQDYCFSLFASRSYIWQRKNWLIVVNKEKGVTIEIVYKTKDKLKETKIIWNKFLKELSIKEKDIEKIFKEE